jgi:hypothetical protein
MVQELLLQGDPHQLSQMVTTMTMGATITARRAIAAVIIPALLLRHSPVALDFLRAGYFPEDLATLKQEE